MSDELEDVHKFDEDERREEAIRSVALRNAVGRMREVLVEPLTEEKKRLLDDFDRFRQQNPFDLKSLTEDEVSQMQTDQRPSMQVQPDDWEGEQETLYVLQDKSLMEQIERSLRTHQEGTGYRPSQEELDMPDQV